MPVQRKLAMAGSAGCLPHSHTRRQRVMRSGLVLCGSFAVLSLILITWTSQDAEVQKPNLKSALRKNEETPTVFLTPSTIQAILNLPETVQKALILQATSRSQERAQNQLISEAVISKLSHDLVSRPEESDFSLPKEHLKIESEEGEPVTITQIRAMECWALIFVTIIATASIFFESFHETLNHMVPETLLQVVNKFFGELATLGFIGTVTFILIKFGLLARLSIWFTGETELLIEEFEMLHYIIFVVMVLFISCVLILLVNASGQEKIWYGYQKNWEARAKEAKNTPRNAWARDLLTIPNEGKELTVVDEVLKSSAVREAEFHRFKHRFIQDQDNEVEIPPDFDFAKYMAYASSHVHTRLVEIGVYDWLQLWIFFALSYFLSAVVQLMVHATRSDAEESAFGIRKGASYLVIAVQIGLVIAVYLGFTVLLRAKYLLMPAASLEQGAPGYGSIAKEQDAVIALQPPYVSQMKVVVDDSDSFVAKIFSILGTHKLPNKHQQVFGMLSSHGPSLLLQLIKLALLLNLIILTAVFTVLWQDLNGISILLPWFLVFIALGTFLFLPQMIFLYTWCCSVELMKHRSIMLHVLHQQKYEKIVQMVRSLKMLSFFIDQIEMISQLKDGHEKMEITDEQWKALLKDTDPKDEEELHILFNLFDVDSNGTLDQAEVCELASNYLGASMTQEEAIGLFRIMDADGNGTVDFREFATVILHLKKQRVDHGKTNVTALADKIFNLFDKSGDGQINVDEVSATVSKFGKNWDTESIYFFFNQIDKDGSGTVSKSEFLEFLQQLQHEL